jgi:hypothetical protein
MRQINIKILKQIIMFIKRLFFVLLLLLIIDVGVSQQQYDTVDWCPTIGTTWLYNGVDGMDGSITYYKFVYEKDSIVAQKNVKVLSVYIIIWSNVGGTDNYRLKRQEPYKIEEEYLYEQNDSVFWFDKKNSRYLFLYSWNLQVGDSLYWEDPELPCYPNEYEEPPPMMATEIFIVSSTSSFVHNELYYKISHLTPKYNRLTFGSIISKIGTTNSFFPQMGYECYPKDVADAVFDRYQMSALTCYADSIRGVWDKLQSWGDEPETCSGERTVANEDKQIITKNTKQQLFKLHPNPISDEVCIEPTENATIKQIKIIDIKGRELHTFSGKEKCLKITFLPVGIYFARIADNNGNWETLKFIKAK